MSISDQISVWLSQITPTQIISYILIPILVFALSLLAFQIVRATVYYRLEAFKQRRLGAMLAERVKRINFITGAITAGYVAMQTIPNLNVNVRNAGYMLLLVVWIWQFFQLASGIINYFTDKALERESGPENETAYKFLNRMFKVALFFIALLLILSNLGYDVTSLVAGLGIGGIAIALAVQNVLSDVITSFSIIADKPFKPGDFITFDNFSGWVLRIGIKSTRMRSVEGEELIVANSKLVGSVVRNFTSSECRRATQTLIINYGIDDKLLQDIPAFISDVIQTQENVDKNDYSINLVRFDASGYVFELTFNVLHPDQRKFLESQQNNLFAINDKLHAEGIQFV